MCSVNCKISVIMPVYNSGIYLRTAVDSILSQSMSDFELILVDDGSTDGSSLVCNEYSKEDNRVKVLHQSNKGICEARNAALKVAKGEFIAFSDHDDEYLPNLLNDTYKFAKKNDLDVVKFGHRAISYKKNKKVKSTIYNSETAVYLKNLSASVFSLYNKGVLTCVWDGLFKKAFLDKNEVRFDPIYKTGGEDIEFVFHLISFSPRLGVLSTVYYNHYIRFGFSTSTLYKKENVETLFVTCHKINDYLGFLDIKEVVKKERVEFVLFFFRIFLSPLFYYLSFSNGSYKKSEEYIRRSCEELPIVFFSIPFTKILSKNFKIGVLLFLYKNKLWRICSFFSYLNRKLNR